MRFWPRRRWLRFVFVFLLVFIVVSVSALAYVSFAINSDVVTDVVVLNSAGSSSALIFYFPGLSSFAHDVAYSFADGLVFGGWRVEIATPSEQAPVEVSNYDLLVVCFSTYAGRPDSPTMRHLERIGSLEGVNIVLVGLAAGDAGSSLAAVREAVLSAGGNVVRELALLSMAPNEGDKSAVEIAMQTGREFSP